MLCKIRKMNKYVFLIKQGGKFIEDVFIKSLKILMMGKYSLCIGKRSIVYVQ